MAEVLITLGIIGVVAALTIPSLIENHNKRVVETRLKNFYSSINEAIKFSEIDNGPKETWAPINTDEFWNMYLKNYLKYKSDNRKYGENCRLVYLPDGSAFFVNFYSNHKFGNFVFCPGAKYCEGGWEHKKYGRTQFVFTFGPACAYIYHKNKGVESSLYGWNGREESLYYGSFYSCTGNTNNPKHYCTAIIQRNGWKIPDEYPYKVRY